MQNSTTSSASALSELTRFDYVPGESGRMVIGQDDGGQYVLRADVEALLGRLASALRVNDDRNAALEEAALLCENYPTAWEQEKTAAQYLAEEIRSLKRT